MLGELEGVIKLLSENVVKLPKLTTDNIIVLSFVMQLYPKLTQFMEEMPKSDPIMS